MSVLDIILSIFLTGLSGCKLLFIMFIDIVVTYKYLCIFVILIAVFATTLRSLKD